MQAILPRIAWYHGSMGKLIYAITTSLDGFVADKSGNFDWAEPTEEVHAFVNSTAQSVGTYLLGRKMYEILKVWDSIKDTDSPAMNQFGDMWRSASKIVYSKSLGQTETTDTTIEGEFNPDQIRQLKKESDKDLGIGGPHLAAAAIKAGLVDEIQQIIAPIIIGDGNHWLPKDVTQKLELVETRRFENGFVHLAYKVI
jgi:dihydrofolate reductase